MLNKKSDSSSFISFADTFHPEIAATTPVAIATAVNDDDDDIRRRQDASPWGTVWAEAKIVPEGPFSEEAAAAQVVIDHPDDNNKAVTPTAPPSRLDLGGSNNLEATAPTLAPGLFSIVAIIIGSTLIFAAVVATYALEVAAVIVFFLASGFHQLAKWFEPLGLFGTLFQLLFLLISKILLMVDGLLLTVSVLVAELLAVIAIFLCSLFGGCTAAREWHQHIRKICHLTRWAFRRFHSDWEPKRQLSCGKSTDDDHAPSS